MDVFTVMVMPEGPGRVRRYRVQRRLVLRVAGGIAAGVVVLMTFALWPRSEDPRAAGLAAEVSRLHAEVASHEEQARAYAGRAKEIDAELDRLREFERRVRVIANLPKAENRAVPIDENGPPGPALSGVGGGAERPEDATLPLGAPALPASHRSANPPDAGREIQKASAAPPPVSASPPPSDDVLATWRALDDLASRIEMRARHRGETLHQLEEALQGKAELLATTPSILPTRGWITSGFGWRISPFTGQRDLHEGLDVAADFGTPIVAPARGVVVFTGGRGAFGRIVVIDHGHGLRTTFAHTERTLVKVGQRVERGDVIATVGSSGRSTGPHVHYGVELSGSWVNPMDYVVDFEG